MYETQRLWMTQANASVDSCESYSLGHIPFAHKFYPSGRIPARALVGR